MLLFQGLEPRLSVKYLKKTISIFVHNKFVFLEIKSIRDLTNKSLQPLYSSHTGFSVSNELLLSSKENRNMRQLIFFVIMDFVSKKI